MNDSHRKTIAYRPDIDGLRALAVMAVVIFHAFPAVLPGGFVGVDIFFVISGFLISHIIFSGLRQGEFRFRAFYAQRIRRIFPALVTVLCGSLAIGWFVMTPDEYKRLGGHVVASAVFIQNINLWHEVSYFDIASSLKPLLHLWSLSVEEQFYLLYPLLLWLVWKTGFSRTIVLLLLMAASIGIHIGWQDAHPEATFYLLPMRFWELLSGGVVASLQERTLGRPVDAIPRAIVLNAMSILGLGSMAVILFTLNHANPRGLFAGLIATVIGTGCVIHAGLQARITQRILAAPVLVYIGLISYPLYLWHWVLLAFLRILQPEQEPAASDKLLAVALGFVLAWATYEVVERYFRLGKQGKSKIAVLVLLLALIAFAGMYIDFRAGLPARYPQAVQPVVHYSFDSRAYGHYGKCWVAREAPDNVFAPECVAALSSPGASHAVLIWGDSHAAHLFPGIKEVWGGQRTVVELARSTCPPILGLNNNKPDCIRGNEAVFDDIKKHAPETVVLFALWGGYAERWTAEMPMAVQLLETIRKLKSAGVQNVVLVGPAPQWTADLPYLVLREMLHDAPQYRVPQRLKHSLKPRGATIDADLRALVAQEKGVQYFSVIDALCNMEGCLVRTSDAPTSFTAFDYGHLTLEGARYVARQLPLSH